MAVGGRRPPRFRAAIALGITPYRVGEVLAVTSDRLDLDRRRLLIDRQLQRIGNEVRFTSPKREKVRTVALPQVAALELATSSARPPGGWASFPGPARCDVALGLLLRRCLAPRSREYKLRSRPVRVHSLRHFAASSMLAEGAPPTAVAGHLGDTLDPFNGPMPIGFGMIPTSRRRSLTESLALDVDKIEADS